MMLFVTSAIDRPKSVPQRPCSRMWISIFNILIFNIFGTIVILIWSNCIKVFSFKFNMFRSVTVIKYFKQYFYNAMDDWLHYFCREWEGWALVNRFNNTSGVTAVTPTDRPTSVRKSLCNRSFFGGVFYVVTMFFCIFLWLYGRLS